MIIDWKERSVIIKKKLDKFIYKRLYLTQYIRTIHRKPHIKTIKRNI